MKSTSWDDILNRNGGKRPWVYQVYPRSFKDSDGDGIGDLKGITSRLTIISKPGWDVVWSQPDLRIPQYRQWL